MMEYFNGIATLITGAVALSVFWLQKRSEKIKAARVILMEIRYAEEKIKEIRNNIPKMTSVLPNNSWQKYSHLFVKELDRDELDLLNDFYAKCEAVEGEIKKINNFLPLAMEEKMKVIQIKLLELADLYKNGPNNMDANSDYAKHREAILETFHNETYYFAPYAPKKDLLKYIKDINVVTTSSCGSKLKKIAKMSTTS